MKKLLFLLLLAGCTDTPAENPAKKAVANYLNKSLDDPASYQPVGWGPVKPWTKQDADHVLGQQQLEIAAQMSEQALHYQSLVTKIAGNQLPVAKQQAIDWQKEADNYSAASDIASKKAPILNNSTDTTRLGSFVVHTYRAKNKSAALVLDSAGFIVLKNGKVTMTKLE
jgi:outer membrane lipoprotein-sorting protein